MFVAALKCSKIESLLSKSINYVQSKGQVLYLKEEKEETQKSLLKFVVYAYEFIVQFFTAFGYYSGKKSACVDLTLFFVTFSFTIFQFSQMTYGL